MMLETNPLDTHQNMFKCHFVIGSPFFFILASVCDGVNA